MLNYRKLTTQEEIKAVAEARDEAWKHAEMPQRQYDVNIKEILFLDLGEWGRVAPFRTFIDAITNLSEDLQENDPKVKVLEIGCSSGYYGKLLKKAGFQWDYTGCDYSPHYKEFAAKHFPDLKIDIEDARALSYPDASFDVVVSGCCLIHIYDWQKAMAETVRASKKYVIFSRTPLLETSPTIYYEKTAYEIPCLEIWFNRQSFEREIEKNGLKIIKEVPVFRDDREGGYSHVTIVCEKV